MKEEKSPIDAILDENDNSTITLFNEKNQPVEFEQIAVISLEDTIYSIMQPVVMPKGADPDEALVFVIEDMGNNQAQIKLVTDDKVIDEVFAAYEKLYNDQINGDKE